MDVLKDAQAVATDHQRGIKALGTVYRQWQRERGHITRLYNQAKQAGDWKAAHDHLYRMWGINQKCGRILDELTVE